MAVIVSFSSRKGGNFGKIGAYLANMIPDSQLFSFANFTIRPCGDCGYECFQSREACPHFQDMEYRLMDAITNSMAAIFVVPNYCDYPNANFFAFNSGGGDFVSVRKAVRQGQRERRSATVGACRSGAEGVSGGLTSLCGTFSINSISQTDCQRNKIFILLRWFCSNPSTAQAGDGWVSGLMAGFECFPS